jgi:hypothetical protein
VRRLFTVHFAKGGEDDKVTGRIVVGGGAIDTDHARTSRARDGIGDNARALVDVPDVQLLMRQDIGRLHQCSIDRTTALVVQVGMGDAGAVNFG